MSEQQDNCSQDIFALGSSNSYGGLDIVHQRQNMEIPEIQGFFLTQNTAQFIQYAVNIVQHILDNIHHTMQYIILKDGILRFNSSNITSKRGVYFTVHSLGSIRTNCQ